MDQGGDMLGSDSSDDDREPFEQKYNECGKFIKSQLKSETLKSESSSFDFYGNGGKLSSWKLGLNTKVTPDTEKEHQPKLESVKKLNPVEKRGMEVDSFESVIGLRIMNPLIMASTLREKMAGRNLVSFFKLRSHVQHGDLSNDWCLAGVIVGTNTKVSMKGKNYCIWKLSDLKLGLKTASLFLFGGSYSALWKTPVGTVIGVLNPSVMDSKKDATDEAMVSIFNGDQVMIFGQSKDFGFCKAKKNDGDSCKQFVNKSHCEFCIYHVQKEYKKFSNKRSNLQSPTSGGLQNLRNKVLGKNEVFYAGKSYTAVKPVKTKKVLEKDKKLLSNLFGNEKFLSNDSKPPSESKTSSEKIDFNFTRFKKIKDAELLNRLSVNSESSSQTLGKTNEQTFKLDGLHGIGGNKKPNILEDESDKKPVPSRRSAISENLKTENKNGSLLSASDFLSQSFSKVKKKESLPMGSLEKLEQPSSKYNKIKKDKEMVEITVPKNSIKTEIPKILGSLSVESSNCSGSIKKRISLTKEDAKSMNSSSMVSASDFLKTFSKDKIPKNVKNSVASNDVPSNVQQKEKLFSLSDLSNNKYIDLSSPITNRHREAAKKNALKFIQKNGPIKKLDPNGVRGKMSAEKRKAFHLNISSSDEKDESVYSEKGSTGSVLSKRFLELMSKTSKHDDLLQEADDKQMEEYFLKMSKKEDMEEKMLNTYKIPCKAVRCLKCKYTWFSASDFCKQDQHPIKVVDAMKRFFKCNDCGNRTATFEIIPLLSCKQCGGSNWKRAPLLSEKRTLANLNQLSIRGGEQKFMNSVVTDTNLNLLVPD